MRQATLAQEALVGSSSTPWTILHATQFHEFAARMFVRAKAGPLHLAPHMRTQPIAASEVAEHLVALAEGAPQGRAQDVAGPREESLVDMVRGVARAQRSRAWILALALAGAGGRAQRDGSLLPGPDARLGVQRFDEWLAALKR